MEVQPISSDASEVEDSSDIMAGDGLSNKLPGDIVFRQRHNGGRYQSRQEALIRVVLLQQSQLLAQNSTQTAHQTRQIEDSQR